MWGPHSETQINKHPQRTITFPNKNSRIISPTQVKQIASYQLPMCDINAMILSFDPSSTCKSFAGLIQLNKKGIPAFCNVQSPPLLSWLFLLQETFNSFCSQMGTQVIWFLGLLGTDLFSYIFVMSILQNALLPATVNKLISQDRNDYNVSGTTWTTVMA